MKHLVQFSTGLSSAEVAWRLVDRYGRDDVVLMTADTTVEDPDNWRFAGEVRDRLGCEWVRLRDGRTPMQAGRDRKCVPNDRMAVCSQILKRELLRRYLDEHYDPAADLVYIGYGWDEPHRIKAAARYWAPWTMRAPLAEPPYADDLKAVFRSRGIEPPDLYRYGFAHANCGGGCVRSGQAQWRLLLTVHRNRFLAWETEEEQTRRELGKNVAILTERGKPLPLRALRERLDRQPGLFDPDDWGACGCDMDGSLQDVQGEPGLLPH
jgi:hypothetical protein